MTGVVNTYPDIMTSFIRNLSVALLLTVKLSAGEVSSQSDSSEKITFSNQIAPLFYQKCVNCHRPGEAAPFSLLDYAGAKRRARTIRRVVSDRYMPPWKPVPGHGNLKGSLRLTASEINLIRGWIDAGAPEGDPQQAPAPPVFAKGWHLGKPDLIVEMDEAFEVYAEGKDIYRYFCLPLNLSEDKWVRAIEIRPSARSVVHHALFFLDNTGNARKLQKAETKPGFKGKGFKATGSLGAWAVGGMPLELDDQFARFLQKGSDLVLQTHFHPSGKLEKEKTRVGIYFAKQAPERLLGEFQIPPGFGSRTGLMVPAGESNYTLKDHLIVPGDLDLVTVWAHAHQIGSSMKADATLPDGKKIPLFYIDEWDFNWQGQYQYKNPVRLPKGTRIDVTIVYDNSADNIDNPNSPPRRIFWGEESDDEMGSIIFGAVAADKKQESTVAAGLKVEAKKSRARFAEAQALVKRTRRVFQLDANHDDRVTLSETPEKHHKFFHRLDSNNDLIVTAEEIEKNGSFLPK